MNTGQTHTFINTGQTHTFINAGQTHTFINTGQTHTFINAGQTHTFIEIFYLAAGANIWTINCNKSWVLYETIINSLSLTWCTQETKKHGTNTHTKDTKFYFWFLPKLHFVLTEDYHRGTTFTLTYDSFLQLPGCNWSLKLYSSSTVIWILLPALQSSTFLGTKK